MKIIKRILIVLFSLVALFLIIALFVEKDYHVERSVIVNKPREEVFDYLKYLKNQDEFSVWAAMDPNMKKTYKGTDGTIGFVSAWDSQKEDVGAGEQEIVGITQGKRIDYELRFKRPMESVCDAYMTTTGESNNSTSVTWGIKGSTPYPFNFFMLFMNMDEMLGKDLDEGLNNLKQKLEKQ